ncbi:MAG: hypothetical protein PUB34_03480 [Clostridia bacterium]|nr:hypothetical protein [Clostridia bacterium]
MQLCGKKGIPDSCVDNFESKDGFGVWPQLTVFQLSEEIPHT